MVANNGAPIAGDFTAQDADEVAIAATLVAMNISFLFIICLQCTKKLGAADGFDAQPLKVRTEIMLFENVF